MTETAPTSADSDSRIARAIHAMEGRPITGGRRRFKDRRVAENDAIRLDFNEPARIDEAGNFDEGAGRLELGEQFLVRFRRIAPGLDIREHDPGPDDIAHTQTGCAQSAGNDLQASLGLPIYIAGRGHRSIQSDRSGAGNGQQIAYPDRAGKAGGGLKRRS
jgi:hypothetical protein